MKVSRISSIVALGFAAPVFATDYTDTAQVVAVTPIYERVADARQECYVESAPAGARNICAETLA